MTKLALCYSSPEHLYVNYLKITKKLHKCYSSPEHLYVNYLKITKKLHNLILDIKDVF